MEGGWRAAAGEPSWLGLESERCKGQDASANLFGWVVWLRGKLRPVLLMLLSVVSSIHRGQRICALPQSRVLHGVRPEILALSEIPFVKAYTARLLYRAGLR